MSGLLGKAADQLSGQKPSQPSSGSSGLMHKLTDALTGQKHPQDSQNYTQMYGNNQPARPYAPEGYQTGQFTSPEAQGHYQPPYGQGHGNYNAPNGGFGGHNDGREFYPSQGHNSYSDGHGGYGGPVPHGSEYPSHQDPYARRDAWVGHGNHGERRREYHDGSHNAPGGYMDHGEYRGGNNDPVNYGGGHDERGASYNNSGHGGYERGHGQHAGNYHSGH
ncbi:hypothetical protein PoHVEF18_002269 [Penicillium ochrochloron]